MSLRRITKRPHFRREGLTISLNVEYANASQKQADG
jgi:hypothetical protein